MRDNTTSLCYGYKVVVLTVDNSETHIDGLGREEFTKLRRELSYSTQPSNPYYQQYAKTISLVTKKQTFPTGLLSKVYAFLSNIKQDYKVNDLRKLPVTKIKFNTKTTITPYPEQLEISNLKAPRGIISACTGFGKSITMALLIAKLGVKTLVVVPNLTLKAQLSETFKEIFGDLKNITIENIDSPALNKFTGFDCLIIDEAHHVAAKTYRKLNIKKWGGIYYRYFFTATPFRSRSEEQILFESIAGDLIYSISYKQALAKGYVLPVNAHYITVPKTKTFAMTWAAVYSDLVVNNDARNLLICKLLISLRKNNLSTLCLVKEIKHGEYLSDITAIPFVSGFGDNKYLLDNFNSKALDSLIGTTGVVGEGVDTKLAEVVVIAGLGKSKPSFMQQVGRGIRVAPGKTECTVIIFHDKSHKWTKAHFKTQCEILEEEYGVTPTELALD